MGRSKKPEVTIESVHEYFLKVPRKALNEFELYALIFWYLDKYEVIKQLDFAEFIETSMPYYTSTPAVVSNLFNKLIDEKMLKSKTYLTNSRGARPKHYMRTEYGKKITRELVLYWENYRDRMEYRTDYNRPEQGLDFLGTSVELPSKVRYMAEEN